LPKSNCGYWLPKFRRNKERDTRKNRELRRLGWRVLTIWEHEIKRDVAKAASRVVLALADARRGVRARAAR
jgi:DNA mismatch endonuclease (patch repair protein)